jgi:hypothetical protein
MTTIRRVFRPAAFLASVTTVLVTTVLVTTGLVTCTAAAPAFAKILPPPPGITHKLAPPPPPVVHTVTVGGTPGWQIALLMAGAAILAAAAGALGERIRTARRAHVAAGAR